MSRPTKLSPRKLPLQRRARATYDAIIEAAAQIVARDGLASFNTNAVAIRAGVSIGSLYQYFPGKDALMVALIHHQQSRQLETLAQAVEISGNQPLPDLVRILVRAAMAHHHDDAIFATAVDHEEARLPIQPALNQYLAQGGRTIEGLLSRHSEEISDICPTAATTTLPHMVRAIVDAWTNQDPPQLEMAENEAVRAVLGYLGSSQGR